MHAIGFGPRFAVSRGGKRSAVFDFSGAVLPPGAWLRARIVSGASAATRAADVLTLDRRSRGVSDGTIGVRYGFDDGSTQDATMTVAGGAASVPVTLARRWIRRVQKI